MNDKIFLNRISRNVYKENKKKIETHELLKFNDFQKDLSARIDNIVFESYTSFVTLAFVLGLFVSLSSMVVPIMNNTFIKKNVIVTIIGAIILFGLLFATFITSLKFFIKNYLIRFPRIALLITPIFTVILFYNLLKGICPYNLINEILLSIISFIFSVLIIKLLPNYLNVSVSYTITISLSILTIGDKIFPIHFWDFIDAILVVLVVNLNSINIYIKHRDKKNGEIAGGILRNQLLAEETDYEELKKCYAIGGKKYKDKIMENEKFLRKILSMEEDT